MKKEEFDIGFEYLVSQFNSVRQRPLPPEDVAKLKDGYFRSLKWIPFDQFMDACDNVFANRQNQFVSPIEIIEATKFWQIAMLWIDKLIDYLIDRMVHGPMEVGIGGQYIVSINNIDPKLWDWYEIAGGVRALEAANDDKFEREKIRKKLVNNMRLVVISQKGSGVQMFKELLAISQEPDDDGEVNNG